ncbi:MAG: glycosyltransferase [Gemmatimonadetes bacterium]|nr:glycosyltransferase [Gemmatimonadota bacterium]
MRLIAHNDGWELRGNERQLRYLAEGLDRRGHDVLVSCRAGGALAAELERIHIHTTPIRPRGDLALPSALAFRSLLRERRPDAVLLTSWKRVFTGARMARRAGGSRVIVRLGIVRPMPERGTAAWKLRRAFDRWVDALVVNSEAVRRVWLESAPWFAPERVHVIRNGVDGVGGAGGVEGVAGDGARVRRELGVGDEVRLIAAVAALEPRKGIDLLLHALAVLPADIQVVVAGHGPRAESLRALAESLGLSGRVHWLGARADVPDVLAAAAAFALPTRADSVPNALLEAMAAGLPIVTTSGNGAEEALGARAASGAEEAWGGASPRPPAGWIVTPEDPEALATALAEALAAPGGRPEEARWRAHQWFGVERMVDEYERVLFPSQEARR